MIIKQLKKNKMSKHYKQLKKLSKRGLGLTAIEINKEIARSRWNKFRSYWKLSRLFQEMRQEEM